MRIGVPLETSPDERRVALTPDVAQKLVEAGHEIVVAAGAGLGAGHTDEEYLAAGAEVVPDPSAADLVVCVDRPEAVPGGAVLGLLRPFDDPGGLEDLTRSGITAFAFEAVPRTTRAQMVDALSSQATIAGYQAVIEAAAALDRLFPMLTTAAGTLAPARVLVLGAGVAGLQAIATARRLGAVVSAFDVRAAAAEQVRSLGAAFIELEVERQDAAAAGGYAREVAEDEQRRIVEGLAGHVERADAVISTAAIPGRPAPLLIDRRGVERMRRGAVIVDLAASTEGNCELTVPGETIEHEGVVIIGQTDLVSRTAGHASQMYARNVANFVRLVSGEDAAFAPDWDDEIVSAACVARDGEVTHPLARKALGRT